MLVEVLWLFSLGKITTAEKFNLSLYVLVWFFKTYVRIHGAPGFTVNVLIEEWLFRK